MSEEERRAAAAAGHGFIEGQGAITDKGAKDFQKGMGSIEKTAKIGGWAMLIAFFSKMIDISENPMMQVLIDFFSLFSMFLNSAGAEKAAMLAEALFTEENVKIMEDLAEATDQYFINMKELERSMRVWGVVIDALAPGLRTLIEAMEPYREEIEWLNTNMPTMNVQLQGFNTNLAKTNLIVGNLQKVNFGNLGVDIAEDIIDGIKDGFESFNIKKFIEKWLEDNLPY